MSSTPTLVPLSTITLNVDAAITSAIDYDAFVAANELTQTIMPQVELLHKLLKEANSRIEQLNKTIKEQRSEIGDLKGTIRIREELAEGTFQFTKSHVEQLSDQVKESNMKVVAVEDKARKYDLLCNKYQAKFGKKLSFQIKNN